MEGIAQHWEAAPPRANHADCPRQVEEIRNYHRNHGYSDIAYNFLVCNHGQVFVGRGWGVLSAATCNGYWNSRYFSVCWMGGPGHTPTNAALQGLRSVIDEARRRTAGIVIGHRDACATECPGQFLYDWVHAGFPVVNPPAPTPAKKTGLAMLIQDGQSKTIYLLGVGNWRYPSPEDVHQLVLIVPYAQNEHPWSVIGWFMKFGCWDKDRNAPIPARP